MKNASASVSVAAFTNAVEGEVRMVQNSGSSDMRVRSLGMGVWSLEFGVWVWEFGVRSLERKFNYQPSTANYQLSTADYQRLTNSLDRRQPNPLGMFQHRL